MVRKLALIFIMGMAVAGAAATSTPFPVLLVMGVLIIGALSAALRSEQQR